jgi:hypothetical protein
MRVHLKRFHPSKDGVQQVDSYPALADGSITSDLARSALNQDPPPGNRRRLMGRTRQVDDAEVQRSNDGALHRDRFTLNSARQFALR